MKALYYLERSSSRACPFVSISVGRLLISALVFQCLHPPVRLPISFRSTAIASAARRNQEQIYSPQNPCFSISFSHRVEDAHELCATPGRPLSFLSCPSSTGPTKETLLLDAAADFMSESVDAALALLELRCDMHDFVGIVCGV